MQIIIWVCLVLFPRIDYMCDKIRNNKQSYNIQVVKRMDYLHLLGQLHMYHHEIIQERKIKIKFKKHYKTPTPHNINYWQIWSYRDVQTCVPRFKNSLHRTTGCSFCIRYKETQEGLGRTDHLLSFDMMWTAWKTKTFGDTQTCRHTNSKAIS
jgi:hypothetical protein